MSTIMVMKPLPGPGDWRPPSELPDLRRVGRIAIDTETCDEGLRGDRGSAWPWRGGYICGISVACRDESGIRGNYFPLRHPDSENFERENVRRWLTDLIAAGVKFTTHNGIYDWGWLWADLCVAMPPSEQLDEIGAQATLIDENRFNYSLDALCAWRGLPGKDTALLEEAAKAAGFKVSKKTPLQSYIWQLPGHIVGPYAEADAANTLALFESLDPILDKEGTRAAYRLEVDLLPMVHEMRRRGVRIDTAAAEQTRDLLLQKRDAKLTELSEKLGVRVGMEEIGRNKWLTQTFDHYGIAYPRTAKGNPSFTAGTTGWMHKHEHWLPRLIVKADKAHNAGTKFLETYILGHAVNGRVHAEIHPHRSDDGGTRSLRFSYSHPPLQQMTAHDEELAPLIRGVFLPEDGEVWAESDISQQEFRLIVHYAVAQDLRKAKEAAERYRTDPNTDFHQLVSDWTGLERASAKNTNFAKAFGAGGRKFAAMIGKSEGEARAIYDRYDRELPFVRQLAARCQNTAAKQGYLELYDGARRHWDAWEAPEIARTKGLGRCSREEAERRVRDPIDPWYGRRIQRAETHKAMNALVQGSAARHTKLWMRACWREGIVPLLQMHDALACSVASPELAERVAQLGREVVTLEVPVQVDLKFGRSWGDAKHRWEGLTGAAPAPKQNPEPAPRPAPEPEPEPQLSEPVTEGTPRLPEDPPAEKKVPPPPGMPSQMTRKMKADLAARGFTPDQIYNMTPGQAWEHLQKSPSGALRTPEPPPPPPLEIELTRLTKDGGPLTKRISLSPDGTLVKDGAACVMAHGTAERVRLASVDALGTLIEDLAPSQAIALGTLRTDLPDMVEVATKRRVVNGVARSDIIARTGANIIYRGPAFALLDYDSKGMSPAVAAALERAGGFWGALLTVLPALKDAARVTRRSTSAGLSRADTGEALPGSDGVHVYVAEKDGADGERFLRALHDRCWLAGFGWMLVSTSGALLEHSIVDRMVGGPERLVFEGGPVLVPPVQQDKESRRPMAVDGVALDTVVVCPSLSIVEGARLDELKARERERLAPERAKAREAFVEAQAKKLVARTGMLEKAARLVIVRQCEGVLRPDIVLPFDDPELAGHTVGDVLANPEFYEGETLADPLEGVDYGRCVARIMRGADGTPWIHSFAHGRTIYELEHDAASVRKALEAAAKDDVVATFAKLIVAADLDAIERADLRQLAKKLCGAGLRVIDDMLKAAQQKQSAQKAKATQVHRAAQRRDPRPWIRSPVEDDPWLPQMAVINDVIGKVTTARPPARDIDDDAMRVRKLPVPKTHAFTQSEVNVEPEETTND
jgi:DNA polymerase I-like protein with 3'-5' exonuclease and polymerase domains